MTPAAARRAPRPGTWRAPAGRAARALRRASVRLRPVDGPQQEVLRDLAARHGDHVAGLVEDEGLRHLRRPVLPREGEPVVAQARVGDLVLLAELARRVGVVLVGHAQHRAAARELALRALEDRRLLFA